MTEDPSEQFVCAICGETFLKEWTDEEAAAELKVNFPGVTPEECGIACDGCFTREFPEFAAGRGAG